MTEVALLDALTVVSPSGVIGIVLGWFMLRVEKLLKYNTAALNLNSRAILQLLGKQGQYDTAASLSKELTRLEIGNE